MPKLTRIDPSRPPTLYLMQRTLHLLGIRSKVEWRILGLILNHGRDFRWTLYKRGSFLRWVGLLVDAHPDSVKRSLRKLVDQGWVYRGIDIDDQPYIQVTEKFGRLCVLEDQRYRVRRALGSAKWKKLNGDDETADLLYEMSLTKTQSRFKARVEAAAEELIASVNLAMKKGDRSALDTGTGRSSSKGQIGPRKRVRLVVVK